MKNLDAWCPLNLVVSILEYRFKRSQTPIRVLDGLFYKSVKEFLCEEFMGYFSPN